MVTYRYDLKPSLPDHRDFQVAALRPPAMRLPRAAALPFVPPVDDQGQEGACAPFAGTSAMESGMGSGYTDLAEAFLYWNTRKRMGDTAHDTGSDLRTLLDSMLHDGVCPQRDMPYHAGDFATAPSAQAVTDATFKIKAYHACATMNDVRYALAAKMPVLLGITVHTSFERIGANGRVPLPAPGEQMLGGHAVMLAQYADRSATASGPNSWGVGFGDKGWIHFPYAYLANPNWTFERWAVQV